MIRVFRFVKDVQHEPRAQMAGHSKGEILMAGRGVSVSRRGDKVSLVTGHGTADDFSVGEEVEELTAEEAKPYIREKALSKLTSDEKAALA